MKPMSVSPSLSGKNRQRDDNGKGTMGCGSEMGLSWGCEEKEKGETKKMLFCGARGLGVGNEVVMGFGSECGAKGRFSARLLLE